MFYFFLKDICLKNTLYISLSAEQLPCREKFSFTITASDWLALHTNIHEARVRVLVGPNIQKL